MPSVRSDNQTTYVPIPSPGYVPDERDLAAIASRSFPQAGFYTEIRDHDGASRTVTVKPDFNSPVGYRVLPETEFPGAEPQTPFFDDDLTDVYDGPSIHDESERPETFSVPAEDAEQTATDKRRASLAKAREAKAAKKNAEAPEA